MTADRPPPKRPPPPPPPPPPPEKTIAERPNPETAMRRATTALATAPLQTLARMLPDNDPALRKDAATRTIRSGGASGGLFDVALPLSRRRKLSLYLGAFATLLALSFFVDVHRAAIDRNRRSLVQLSMPLAGAGRPGIGDAAAAAAVAAAATATTPSAAGEEVETATNAHRDSGHPSSEAERVLVTLPRANAGTPSSPDPDAPVSADGHASHRNALPHAQAAHSLQEKADLPAAQHPNLPDAAAAAAAPNTAEGSGLTNGAKSNVSSINAGGGVAVESVDGHTEQPALQGRFSDISVTAHDKNLSPQELKDDVDQLIAHVDEESSLEEEKRASDAGSHHAAAGTDGLPDEATPSTGRADVQRFGGGGLEGAVLPGDSSKTPSGEAGLGSSADIGIKPRQPPSHEPVIADASVETSTERPLLSLSADRSSTYAGRALSFGALAQSRIRRFFGLETSSPTANVSIITGLSNGTSGTLNDASSDPRASTHVDDSATAGAEIGDADETVEQRFEKAQRRFQLLLKQDRGVGRMDDADVLVVQALGLQATRGNCEDTNSADGGSLFKSDAEAASGMDVERSDPLWGAWCMFMGTYKSDAMRDYATMLTLVEAKVGKLSADTGASNIATGTASVANENQSQNVSSERLRSSASAPSSLDDVMSTSAQNLLSGKLITLRVHLPENELRYIGALALQATYGNCAPYGKELVDRKSAAAMGNVDQLSLPELRVLRETLTGQTADRQEGALWGAWCVLHGKSRATSASELAERTDQLLRQLNKAQLASKGSTESEYGLSKGADANSPDLFV